MTADQTKLEQFLKSIEGEIIDIIPSVTVEPSIATAKVDLLLIVEKVS